MAFSNSSLVNYIHHGPNHSGQRNHAIDTISIHCMAGNLSVETCGSLFANSNTQASSNYGIGSDGRIGLYIDEWNRSWCTSSAANDNRAVTIEVANIEAQEPYRISTAAYNSLIKLCADICMRNGIKQLLWKGDKSLIGQVSKQNMTVHRWFAAKSCPGQWLYDNHAKIAADVNKLIAEKEDDNMTQEDFNKLFNVAMKSYQRTPEQEQIYFNKLFNVAMKSYIQTPEQQQTQFNKMFEVAMKNYEDNVAKDRQEEFTKMFTAAMNNYRKSLQDNDAGTWSKEGRDWAIKTGLIQGGTPIKGQPNYMWEDFLTREQMATLLYRFKDLENLPK